MEHHYTLTRVMYSGDDEPIGSTSFTVSDADAVNCAHMLAAVFNTMSRNFMNGWLLGSVNTNGEGSVEFDGKIERFAKSDPWSVSQTFKFEPSSVDADTLLTMFGDGETPTFTAAGKMSFVEESKYAHVARSVLESAYAELLAVKEQLASAGVETVPADSGVFDLRQQVRRSAEQIAELAQARANTEGEMNELKRRNDFEHSARIAMEQQYAEENEAARSEMIAYLRGAAKKRQQLDPDGGREDLQARYSGMLDVLAKFLVTTGEADADEGHAAARRLIAETED